MFHTSPFFHVRQFESLHLLGDDLVLDAFVDIFRDDLAPGQFVLRLVGTAGDDGLGARLADARQRVEIFR